ncbi:uncharacterized protein LOC119190263 [Manduca sexta]|uniref:uncharacterized protein LOC119190263 n=1 Tax=Manduca sexta TaxID=7130 RepID=UPI00188E06F7|nr:uncharacterized protein LOC119190263 [Manduca sexta]
MFFVHSDCLPALDLSIQVKNESERRLYAVAVVESKEHCYAKKSGNRYNMPRGSRFCRVRVKPARLHPPPCCSADHKHKDAMKGGMLPVFSGNRPLKKWLTYMHAPDMQKSVDTSQSTSSNTDEANKVCEVVTGALINLESPVSSSDAASTSSAPPPPEDQLDSIEAGDHWHAAKMQLSTISAVTDMECSVGRCAEPLDPCVEATALPSESRTWRRAWSLAWIRACSRAYCRACRRACRRARRPRPDPRRPGPPRAADRWRCTADGLPDFVKTPLLCDERCDRIDARPTRQVEKNALEDFTA